MPLIAYDRSGNVLAVLDHLVAHDEDGEALGLVNFEAMEEAGMPLRGCWEVSGAAGSCHWPEHLGERVHEFRVRLDRRFTHPARELVHRRSGHRRDRVEVEAEMERRRRLAPRGEDGRRIVDVRDVVGSPMRPLELDDEGKTSPPRQPGQRDGLPVGGRRGSGDGR